MTQQSQAPEQLMATLLIRHSDPIEIRYHWLEALREVSGASDATAQNLRYDPSCDCLRVTDTIASGENAPYWTDLLQGSTVQKFGYRAENLSGMNAWTVTTREHVPRSVLNDVWDPLAIHSRIGLNAIDGDIFAGHVSLLRSGARPLFQDADVRMLSAWRGATVSLLATTRSMTRTLDESGPIALVYDAAGTVMMAQNNASAPVVQAVSEVVLPMVTAFLESGGSLTSEVTHGAFHCRLTRLSDGRSQAVLASIQPLHAPRVSAFSQLSPAQRTVAAWAARGETLQDIADRLDRSAETVKSHLRQVYVKLEISSRAELAAIYEHALRWATD